MTGPLTGVRVLEFGGIGPGPFCGMVLSDMGADVIRLDRVADVAHADPARAPGEVLSRGRRSIGVDLKHGDGVATVLRLVESADALIEVWRPGVAERLGVGPAECLARNSKLVYGRMTGWGQDGPLAHKAGHDIDYISLVGALHAFGRAGGPPVPPINIVGDFGGGGLLLAMGIACALLAVARGGDGQVVDAAMIDGTAMLLAPFYPAVDIGWWSDERGTNLLDSGSPYYDAYETADGKWLAVGALEPQFYADLLRGLGLDGDGSVPDRDDRARWDELRTIFTRVFASKTRDEWVEVFEPLDACVAPVLSIGESGTHPHNVARGTFVEVAGVRNPAPAPRFSGTPAVIDRPPCYAGQHTDEVLAELGWTSAEIGILRDAGAIA